MNSLGVMSLVYISQHPWNHIFHFAWFIIRLLQGFTDRTKLHAKLLCEQEEGKKTLPKYHIPPLPQ